MATDSRQTHWRGMQVEHPGDWELVIASGRTEPGRCTFADRRYQRLDLRWGPVKYLPDLELLLTKYRQRNRNDAIELEDAPTIPKEWRGLVRKTPDGRVLHAGRFFPQQKWLAEATLVWPKRRDVEVENRVLESVRPEDASTPGRHWQALGVDLVLDRSYDLHTNDSRVGRVRWVFRTEVESKAVLEVERLAMPQRWLKDPLREWLTEQLPEGFAVLRQDMTNYGAHRGETLISAAKIGTLARLRGLRKVRMDLAWQCPTENRLYRLSVTEVTRNEELPLPEPFSIRCCQAPPAVGSARE